MADVSPLSWRPSKLIALGLLIVGAISPLAFTMARGLRTIGVTSTGSVWLPAISFAFLPSVSTIGSATSIQPMVAQTVQGLVYLAIVGVYYLLLMAVIGGTVFFGVGVFRGVLQISRTDLAEAEQSLRRVLTTAAAALRNRWIQGGLLIVAILGLALASSLQSLVLELLFFVIMVSIGILFLGSLTLAAFGYASPVIDIFVLPPLVLMTIVLPPIAAGLLSPSLRPQLERMSNAFSIWVLNTLLSIGGIGGFLSRTFQFQGFEYIVMWASLLLVLGWIGGTIVVGARRAGILAPR